MLHAGRYCKLEGTCELTKIPIKEQAGIRKTCPTHGQTLTKAHSRKFSTTGSCTFPANMVGMQHANCAISKRNSASHVTVCVSAFGGFLL